LILVEEKNMRRPKATIFGGKGFIGSHLAARLHSIGWECHVPDRRETFNSRETMGHVFYCAGLTADYIHRPFDTVEAHVTLLSKILQLERFESLVYLSSTRLYDSQSGEVGTEELSLSLNPTNPRHIYDLSKALGESLCFVAGRKRARVARLSCVFNDHTDKEGFLPELLRQIIECRSSSLEVDSSPAFSRDYIHLQDVLDALIMIAVKGKNCIYNVASGENIRNDDLFTALSEASGHRIIPLRNDISAPLSTVSIQKIQEEFGWRPSSVLKKVFSIIKENKEC
jgi:UDP-glucose 4-epimerase